MRFHGEGSGAFAGGAGDLAAAGSEVRPCCWFTRVPLVSSGEAAEAEVAQAIPRPVDVDTRRGGYGGPMTKRTWKTLIWAGAAIAIAGVIASAVGFSMDESYPETVPGWAISLVWVGILVTVGAVIGRAVTTK